MRYCFLNRQTQIVFIFDYMFKQSINDCLGYLGQLIVMLLGVGLAFMLLGFWIDKDRPFSYTIFGKILSVVFAFSGSALLGFIVYLMMKELRYAYNTFLMESFFSLFAIAALYSGKIKS